MFFSLSVVILIFCKKNYVTAALCKYVLLYDIIIHKMKILVVGSGSCEHAVVNKLKQSSLCDDIFCIKGNAGISGIAKREDIAPSDAEALADFAEKNQIGLTLSCSHVPIQNDISGIFEMRGLKILAPSAEAVRFLLHSDKIRPICEECGIVYLPCESAKDYKQIICMADGAHIVPLPFCFSYYSMYDNNEGSRTSGMGAYMPSEVDHSLPAALSRCILEPLSEKLCACGKSLKGLLSVKFAQREEGLALCGFDMHISGAMMAVLLEKMESDFVEVLIKGTDGMLSKNSVKWNKKSVVSVVMVASAHSPNVKEHPVIKLPEESGADIFHSRTVFDSEGNLRAAGNRVLCVCGSGKTTEDARELVYDTVSKISFEGMYYRSDIARQVKER